MTERLNISSSFQDGLFFIRLSGVVDEDSSLEEAVRDLQPETIVAIDTAGVTRINSCGVRDWVNWLSYLEAKRAHIVLLNCSVHIVDQLNMVHNFIGQGRIKSFHAPYYCEDCDQELMQYLEVAEIADPQAIHPPCPRCSRPMELDHLPEQFFAFLEDRERILVDAETTHALAQLGKNFYNKIRELDGGPRQAPQVALPPASLTGPLAPAPPQPARLAPAPASTPASDAALRAANAGTDRQPALAPPSLRQARPLRDRTGPQPLGALSDTAPPQPESKSPSLPQSPPAPLSRPVLDNLPRNNEVTTAPVVLADQSPAPRTPHSESLSPLATVLLIAGIIVVFALMFILVFGGK